MFLRCFLSVVCILGAISVEGAACADTVFINEIHYDNISGDTGEGVEIAGTVGFDLSGWQVLLVNGGNGEMYGSPIALSGVIPEQQNGFGTLSFMYSGIQNGPDGFALIDDLGSVVQFLSYEGSFTAVEGPVAGLESIDIGVGETTSTEVGFSLQLTGAGSEYSDFSWINPQENSFGTINAGQTFAAVPLPSALVFMVPCLLGLFGLKERRRG